jgi:hypothetical protein
VAGGWWKALRSEVCWLLVCHAVPLVLVVKTYANFEAALRQHSTTTNPSTVHHTANTSVLALGNRGGRTNGACTHALTHVPPPPPPHGIHAQNISPTAFSSDNRFFCLFSSHIGIRQGALPKFQGDLEAVASPWGSSQLGGHPAILSRIRFLY